MKVLKHKTYKNVYFAGLVNGWFGQFKIATTTVIGDALRFPDEHDTLWIRRMLRNKTERAWGYFVWFETPVEFETKKEWREK